MPGGVNGAKGAKKAAEYIKNKQSETKPAQPQKDSNKLAEALSNQNSTNNNGNVVGNGGDVIDSGNNNGNIGSGNVTNSGNTTIIHNPSAEDTQPTPPTPPKVKLDKDAVKQGKDLAHQMHDQTSSAVANNTKVNRVLRQVDTDNAYTFFSEYAKLARTDDSSYTTGVMHDAHGLVEATIFTSVDNEDTFPALNALLAQAGELGLGGSVECQRLESLMQQHKNDSASLGEVLLPGGTRRVGNDDISAETGRVFDAAVRNLLAKMSTKIEQ